MNFRRKLLAPIFGGLFFLSLVAGLFFLQTSVLLPAPNKADCEIYRTLVTDVYEAAYGYEEVFRPKILTYPKSDIKTQFPRSIELHYRTDEMEMIPASEYNESYEIPIYKSLSVDISQQNWVTPKEETQKLKKCFRGNSTIRFSHLSLTALNTELKVKGKTDISTNIWQVSDIYHSTDGRYAILYVDSHCGGLCGWGGLYFFENKNGHWNSLGQHTLWVS